MSKKENKKTLTYDGKKCKIKQNKKKGEVLLIKENILFKAGCHLNKYKKMELY